ncbi:hypothetical protein Ddye_002133 [Dipteronia dyeriana]|uniref:F-box domain-containing protein n=1 Tax=Dipteronia dyeriana TaxID=168575 RepID=A0AAD9XPX8_9ROSI|nr:hypothetical protein Ddye_002133 [Dipteronia dyeriana]
MTCPSLSPKCVGLANLLDELLVKILDHLPSQSDVVACTVVCKHWFSLISTFFKSRTIHRHQVENVKNTRITFLIKSSGLSYVGGTSSNPLLKRTGRSQLLKFLPCYMPDYPVAIHIVASFKDLLLCCQRPCFESVYYLCNILTKQWSKLPRAPEHDPEGETLLGLICYSSFPCHHQNWTNLYSQYSYRVARILVLKLKEARQQFTAEIFCSVTGTWSKSVVSSPRPLKIGLHYYDNKNVVVCDGIMYWMNGGKKREIVAYDPLNDTDSCRVIDSPSLELEY